MATILSICQDTLDEVQFDPIDTLVGSEEPIARQTLSILRRVGEELARYGSAAGGWPVLQRRAEFSLEAGETLKEFPTDFARMVSNTVRNETQNFAIPGPATGFEQQAVEGIVGGAVNSPYWKVAPSSEGRPSILIHPAPSDTEVISYLYISSAWVRHPDGTLSDEILNNTDEPLLDQWLLRIGLQAAFKAAKSLDPASAQADRALYEAEREKKYAEAIGVRAIPLASPTGRTLRRAFGSGTYYAKVNPLPNS